MDIKKVKMLKNEMELLDYTRLSRTSSVFVNQGLSSFSNLVVVYYLVSTIGVEQSGYFGAYFLAASYVMSLFISLIAQPLISIAPQLTDTDKQAHIYSAAWANILASIVICFIGFILGLALTIVNISISETLLGAIFASSILFTEFWRRIAFLKGLLVRVWLFDAVRFGLLIMLFLEVSQTKFAGDAQGYVVAMSVSNLLAVAVFGMPTLLRMIKSFEYKKTRLQLTRLINSGRWLGLSVLFTFISENLVVYLAFFLLGAYEGGIIRIVQTIVNITNPITQGMENVVPKWLGHLRKSNGAAVAARQYKKHALAIFCGLSSLYVLIGLFPSIPLGLFSIENNETAMWLLRAFSFGFVITIAQLLILYELRARESTKIAYTATASSAILAIVVSWPLLTNFGLIGVGVCIVIVKLFAILIVGFNLKNAND